MLSSHNCFTMEDVAHSWFEDLEVLLHRIDLYSSTYNTGFDSSTNLLNVSDGLGSHLPEPCSEQVAPLAVSVGAQDDLSVPQNELQVDVPTSTSVADEQNQHFIF